MADPICVGLGVAVSKAVFKAWFKDNEFASSAAESLSDLVGNVVSDRRASSAAHRQLQRISEMAAETLDDCINVEFGDLDEDQKYAAASQCQEGVDRSSICAKLISEVDFSHTALTDLIIANIDERYLEARSLELSKFLASESAQLIIDISASLPDFQRDTVAEILRRETELIKSVDQVFSELEKIRNESFSNSPLGAYSDFEQLYRRTISRRLDQIELFGLNATQKPSTRRHNLSTAYISLSVNSSSPLGENDNESGLPEGDAETPFSEEWRPSKAEEAAAASNRVVVKGEAGSGKTTLLQSLAVRCATASFTGRMTAWNRLVPLFLQLRAMSGTPLPPPEDFPKFSTPAIAGSMPNGWVHSLLAEGRAILLIDGLDEVSDARREETRQWIQSILDAYPDVRVIATSRPPAIPDGWLSDRKFADVELLPMSPDDVSTFIDHWHDAVCHEEHDEQIKAETRKLALALRERIRADRALRELASTPLLCAMLCAMNRDRREVLPSNRLSLYEAATQMILHGRDEQRKLRVDDLLNIDYDTKRELLQIIAFWMMENGLSMAEEWRIIDLVRSNLPRFSRLPAGSTSDLVVKTLIHRSGLLRSPIDGQCDFIHNAFKEYLCARAVSDGDRFGFLQSAVSSSEAWREVAPMAAALTDDARRSAFLKNLLERGDASPSKRSMYHLLAVRCLETCTQLDPDLQKEVRRRLSGLRAPRSMGEAKALSAAGDLAINLAKRTPTARARTAASCVRTLRLIGSADALDAMEAYGGDSRNTVVKELMAAWPFFDRREYARRVLSKSNALWDGITVYSLEGLEGVSFLQSLPRLSINVFRQTLEDKHFSEFNQLPKLEYLSIKTGGPIDCSKLSKLTNLSSIRLEGANISELDALSFMPKLRAFDGFAQSCGSVNQLNLEHLIRFSINGKINAPKGSLKFGRNLSIFFAHSSGEDLDLSCLSDCDSLSRVALTLHNFRRAQESITNYDDISGLFLFKSRDLNSIDNLPAMPNINDISIRGCSSLENLSGIEKYQNLSEVSLSGTGIKSIDALMSLPKLRQITLDLEDISFDLEILKRLPSLNSLCGPASFLHRARSAGIKTAFREVRL